MTLKPERFPYCDINRDPDLNDVLPHLPMKLTCQREPLSVVGMLDTGSAVSVLPYDIGLRLGAVWGEQKYSVKLAGNLASLEAYALVAYAEVASFRPVRLVFAWTQSNDVPVILGQTNFFMDFDAYFYGSQKVFEIIPKNR